MELDSAAKKVRATLDWSLSILAVHVAHLVIWQ